MEFVNAVIGDVEIYVPVNDKLGSCIFIAHKRLNYRRYIAKKRKYYQGEIEKERINMDSDFFYALEDVLEEKGYEDVIHHQFEKCSTEDKKILYDIMRSDIHMLAKTFITTFTVVDSATEYNYLADLQRNITIMILATCKADGEIEDSDFSNGCLIIDIVEEIENRKNSLK